jgi:hypothetical protein
MNEKPDSGAAAAAASDADAMVKPSEMVADAITGFAKLAGVDPEQLLSGARFECNGMGAWLCHHGQRDTEGVVLVLDMGQYPESDGEPFLRFALEHNLTAPAALQGYYALVPGTHTLGYCVRLDLARAQNGAAAIATVIGTLVRSVEAVQKSLAEHFEHFEASSKDGGAEKVFA